jgi:hypothetical protein
LRRPPMILPTGRKGSVRIGDPSDGFQLENKWSLWSCSNCDGDYHRCDCGSDVANAILAPVDRPSFRTLDALDAGGETDAKFGAPIVRRRVFARVIAVYAQRKNPSSRFEKRSPKLMIAVSHSPPCALWQVRA